MLAWYQQGPITNNTKLLRSHIKTVYLNIYKEVNEFVEYLEIGTCPARRSADQNIGPLFIYSATTNAGLTQTLLPFNCPVCTSEWSV
jgi:hypothetical protein